MKIYVASSWRNLLQPVIVLALRRCGHEVYDFKNPRENDNGFSWKEVMPGYELGGKVEPEAYRAGLQHPIAKAGYASDIHALRWCDAVVYVMPCGRSASWEFGYAMGQGKKGYVVMFAEDEPDLMFSEAKILTTMNDLFDAFGEPRIQAQEEAQVSDSDSEKVEWYDASDTRCTLQVTRHKENLDHTAFQSRLNATPADLAAAGYYKRLTMGATEHDLRERLTAAQARIAEMERCPQCNSGVRQHQQNLKWPHGFLLCVHPWHMSDPSGVDLDGLLRDVARLRAQLQAAEACVEAADELYDASNHGVLSYEHISVYSSRRAALERVKAGGE